MRNLNVKKTSFFEVTEMWRVAISPTYKNCELFISCNSKGEVNWEKATLYKASELINKKVSIL